VQPIDGQRAGRPWHRVGPAAHHGGLDPERGELLEERGGDPAASDDGHLAVIQTGAGRDPPRSGHDPSRQVAQAGQGQSEGMLGHRLGVGTLGTRPDSRVIEQAGLRHPLDAGEGQLDPPGIGHLGQPGGEPGHVGRVQPYQAVRPVVAVDHDAPAIAHGVGGEGGWEGADGDTGSSHCRTLARGAEGQPGIRATRWGRKGTQ
jgi:hypothetical protein